MARRRIRELALDDWAKITLGVLTAIVGILLAFNLAVPPKHGYIAEMALLVVIGLGSLWKSRESVNAGVFLYCSLVLLPVLAMMSHHAATQDEGAGPFWLIPFFGLLVVGTLTRDASALAGYTGAATAASLATGVIYGDVGLAVFLALIVGVAGVVWSVRLWQDAQERKRRDEQRKRRDEALARLDIIERGLDGILEV